MPDLRRPPAARPPARAGGKRLFADRHHQSSARAQGPRVRRAVAGSKRRQFVRMARCGCGNILQAGNLRPDSNGFLLSWNGQVRRFAAAPRMRPALASAAIRKPTILARTAGKISPTTSGIFAIFCQPLCRCRIPRHRTASGCGAIRGLKKSYCRCLRKLSPANSNAPDPVAASS